MVCVQYGKLYVSFLLKELNTLHEVENYVIATSILFATLFILNASKRRFARQWLKLLSWACYLLIPIAISYILGLIGDPTDYVMGGARPYPNKYGTWATLLLFAYSSFDNLSAFNLEETSGRSKILLQLLAKDALLTRFLQNSPFAVGMSFGLNLVSILLYLKVAERIIALAHAAGATPGVKENLKRIISYANKEQGDHDHIEDRDEDQVDFGCNYLVGMRYATIRDDVVVDGISVEKIWGCKGRLLCSGDEDGQLKDTCLSFSLFWLLLGKFWGYPLYCDNRSKMKARRLIREGLLSKRGKYGRAFRVIEVELSFLHDYFYSKYIFFYLNGFYWKLSFLAFPLMFWWFYVNKIDGYKKDNLETTRVFGIKDNDVTPIAVATVTSVLLALEIIQIIMLVVSRWFMVNLLCYYTKRKITNRTSKILNWCIEKVTGAICRISLFANSMLYKPWKRELDQYSLFESCTSSGIEKDSYLQALGAGFGLPIPKPGRKLGQSVVLSDGVKRAVILSLQTNDLTLGNGVSCLRRNQVEPELSWACKLDKDARVILVWHIATSICEMKSGSRENWMQTLEEDFNTATSLSKYCAYLLAFCPSLLSIPLLEADGLCDTVIQEAREVFMIREMDKFEKLELLLNVDKEIGDEGSTSTVMQHGVKLGMEILSVLRDEGRRWKILAEFWAEIILYMAPSNNNEMVHAEKLADGGEFITHLWALLVHAGYLNRGDITSSIKRK